ncbi:MAG: hypothetical protein AUJ71_00080 [Candidatus Omnitrophica bacterium CG1_02_49_16]|nr:MAG: hypothetical protein AUJ71_00080 [Candidatus Omnitrophica bacterium CG1_02_49_16]
MRSALPKALQTICGETMLNHVLRKVEAIRAKRVLVVAGHKIDLVRKSVGGRAEIVHQKKLLGSGHALNQAAKGLIGFKGSVLVMYCDIPLLSQGTVARLLANHVARSTDCSLLSVTLDDPSSYGRIQRDPAGRVTGIVESLDAGAAEKRIQEVNVGCYVFKSAPLFRALRQIKRNPKKKEYYLTDVIAILARQGRVEAVVTQDRGEVLGANTRPELAGLEKMMDERLLNQWIDKGIRIRDPKTTIIDAGVEIGHDTVILPHTVIEERSVIGKNCTIGPFARIRGASRVGDHSVVGNFVEVVRSRIGHHTQIKHLSYIGDAAVGSFVNIGAGTITANYDGKKKNQTVIKDGAHLGSGTVLVAPVTLGRGVITGAGAVVTRGQYVPDRAVVVGVPARKLPRKK